MRRRAFVPLLPLVLEPAAPEPLFRQLYRQLREAILEGRLSGGQRLPSSRLLADELGCSRNTVVGAFEQLLAEGYLEGRAGSGTYVSSVLPDELLTARREAPQREDATPSPGLGARGRLLVSLA